MSLRETFAANLRRYRNAKDISQEALALAAGVNRTYLSRLEKGTSWPGLEIMCKLASELEIEPAMLILPADASQKTELGRYVSVLDGVVVALDNGYRSADEASLRNIVKSAVETVEQTAFDLATFSSKVR